MVSPLSQINPINTMAMSNPITSSLSKLAQIQNISKQVANNVFTSLSKMSGASEEGITLENLETLKTALEAGKHTNSSAYKLVNTLIGKFEALSSDGYVISSQDFSATVNFATTQNVVNSSNLKALLAPGGLNNYSQQQIDAYGVKNLQTLDFITLMDTLSSTSVNNMLSNINSAKPENSINEKVNDKIQDYKTITKEQLKSPINILL